MRNFTNVTIRLGSGHARNVVVDSNTVLNTLSTAWTQAAIMGCCGDYSGAQVTHNLVDGANYNGIDFHSDGSSGGWINDVTIAQNAVYDTCRTVADCGAIYLWEPLARSTNISVRNNIVGNYGQLDNGSKAIYLDDNASNITVTNNIIDGVGKWSVQFHGGARNTFQNNIFDVSAAAGLGAYADTNDETPSDRMADNAFTCNIVYSEATPQSHLWDLYLTRSVESLELADNLY